jgi:hypothetical protein
MAMASALPLLLAPRPIASPRPAPTGRFLSLSAPLLAAAPVPAAVAPRLSRHRPLHAATPCNYVVAAATGGAEVARAKCLQFVAW